MDASGWSRVIGPRGAARPRCDLPGQESLAREARRGRGAISLVKSHWPERTRMRLTQSSEWSDHGVRSAGLDTNSRRAAPSSRPA